MPSRRIIDNQTGTVVEYLKRALANADDFSFVSAYFTIYGYELLADQVNRVGHTRFLFGDPASVEELDPGKNEPKSFELTEHSLVPNHVLHQKTLAKQCAEWVSKDNVSIRSVGRANFLHGKMYLARSPHGSTSVVGSSNFTKRGLGGSDLPNLEINLATEDPDTVAELLAWFNQLWDDEQQTEDVKQRVLDALARLGRDYSPEAVYYKTLYELFRKNIEARLDGDDPITSAGFQDSQVWNMLYEFQKDGTKSVIAKLREHTGCILADSVGLGKTYTALAVIKYFELRNERVLVLCPKKLWHNWSLYQVGNNHPQNPFLKDRFAYTLLAHTDLSRDSGLSGSVDLANFNWQNYDLVVIDESHNFRNDGGKRYQRLLDEVIRAGSKTKVLMLSATPVNTSLLDLRNQIYLMTERREDAFSKSLGVSNIRYTTAAAQQQFKVWETGQTQNGKRDKTQLLESLGTDFLRLLDGVSISRSRRQIEQFYANEMDRIGRFPVRVEPINQYPSTDLQGHLSYQDIADQIGKFKLAVYQPSKYVEDPDKLAELETRRQRQNFNQLDSERFLVGMMRTNFLKRLESSAFSLTLTLTRTICKIDTLLDKIDEYECSGQSRNDLVADDLLLPDEDEDDEDFVVGGRRQSYRLQELNVSCWKNDLQQDKATLDAVREQVASITPEYDGKLLEIRKAIREKMENPSIDQDGNRNRKLLVFTTFKDTALYLYDNLSSLAIELGVKMGMVSGEETRTTIGANSFNAILTNFAPVARSRSTAIVSSASDIDLLIATDCISEGQNLQDCDTVLNYDIHWNPVRLVQRFGRIDRIGSRNQSVRMVNFWPTEDMDAYLQLRHRVQARMALADLSASGDEDLFTEDDAQRDLSFRDEQLLNLRDEVLDLDDLDDRPTLGDFTLNHFFTQLLRYLERNKDALKAMPLGTYAIAQSKAAVRPGVVFCLQQRNAGINRNQRPASPVHPFYFVYIMDNRSVRYGCANTRQALEVFEEAAAGETNPLMELCDRFDRETDSGRAMTHYDQLLTDAIAHIQQSHEGNTITALLDGLMIPKASESPSSANNFELITWLIIKDQT